MSHQRMLRAFILRVVRLNIGKPLLITALVFVSLLVVFITGSTGSRSGVASGAKELEDGLARATRADSLIGTLLADGEFIPTIGELRWRVGYSPHAFLITVYGIAELGITPNSSAKAVCINHTFWAESCECTSVGSAESILEIVPGWNSEFTTIPDEEAILISQLVNNKSEPHLKGHVHYAICLDTGKFFSGCVSYRP